MSESDSTIYIRDIDCRSTLVIGLLEGNYDETMRDKIQLCCNTLEQKGDKILSVILEGQDIHIILMHNDRINKAITEFRNKFNEASLSILEKENTENIPNMLKVFNKEGHLSFRTPHNHAVQAQFPIEYEDGNFNVVYPHYKLPSI